jgi:hypothetical protein
MSEDAVWQPTFSKTSSVDRWTAPENEEVWTKIDDERGERNVAKLTRKGNLWFTDPYDGGMYVYYTPTHWRR